MGSGLPWLWVMAMVSQKQAVLETQQDATRADELDLVVPFTTPELTRAALEACRRMGSGLNAQIRLVRVHVVPYPMDLDHPPVAQHFLLREMEECKVGIAASCEIRLARGVTEGLECSLRPGSVVVLGYHKRLWPTANERLARRLRDSGRKLILVAGEANHA